MRIGAGNGDRTRLSSLGSWCPAAGRYRPMRPGGCPGLRGSETEVIDPLADLVPPVGVEPTAHGLKIRCSAS